MRQQQSSQGIIFLSLPKYLYTSGQKIQGNVYLNIVKQLPNPSNLLLIKIQAIQHAQWNSGQLSNQRRRPQHQHSNTKIIYEQQLILTNFQSNYIHQGQYQYPFVIYLLNNLPGSFLSSQGQITLNNKKQHYIKYTISAILFSNQKQEITSYIYHLNIRQLSKIPLGVRLTTQSKSSRCNACCCSCINYGDIKFKMSCSKNAVMNGDLVDVSIQVDNSQGSQTLFQPILVIQLKRVMIDRSDKPILNDFPYLKVYHQVLNTDFLKKWQEQILPKQKKQFNTKIQIPQKYQIETTIGTITARWYQLSFKVCQFCNRIPPECNMKLHLNSSSPILMINQIIQTPSNWNPVIAPVVIFNNMKPFMRTIEKELIQLGLGIQNNEISLNNYTMGIYPGFNNSSNNNVNNKEIQMRLISKQSMNEKYKKDVKNEVDISNIKGEYDSVRKGQGYGYEQQGIYIKLQQRLSQRSSFKNE